MIDFIRLFTLIKIAPQISLIDAEKKISAKICEICGKEKQPEQ